MYYNIIRFYSIAHAAHNNEIVTPGKVGFDMTAKTKILQQYKYNLLPAVMHIQITYIEVITI